MGTNYYLHHSQPCPHCNHEAEPIHIGKSSSGWCFALCYDETHFLVSLDDWKLFLKHSPENGYEIRDEYGDKKTYEDLISIITRRGSDKPIDQSTVDAHNNFHDKYGGGRIIADVDEYLRRNQAERGPNNLLRHKLGDNCMSHGEGTWDMIKGEFS